MQNKVIFPLCLILLLIPSLAECSNVGLIENGIWQASLTPVRFSATAWGDVDGDGNMDLALSGCIGGAGGQDCNTGAITKIYTNNGTTLIENATWSSNLTGVGHSSVAWGDIDNDGDLDLAVTGCTSATSASDCIGSIVSKIYINNGTALVENSTWEEYLIATYHGNLAFSDIDNDGRIDLAMAGSTSWGKITKLYINNGTTLVENPVWEGNLAGISWGSLSFAYINDDGRIDLGVTGRNAASNKISKIYISNGSSFIENSTWENSLVQSDESAMIFGDFNNDMRMDMVLMGCCDFLYTYKNDGSTFVESQKDIGDGGDLIGVFDGSIAFGDYNNDGNLDFVGIGREDGRDMVYENNGSGHFLLDYTAANDIRQDDVQHGALAWCDIDDDGDLDLVATGYGNGDGGSLKSKIYLNDITAANAKPSPPASHFNSSYSEGGLFLQWESGTDSETPSAGLYYSIKVGTCSICNDIVSGVYGGSSGGEWRGGGPASGYFGNMMQRKSITLNRQFEPGTTIYWAVQTIDTGLAKSEWSAEQVYMIPGNGILGIFNKRNGTITRNSAVILFDSNMTANATVTYGTDVANLNLTQGNSTLTLNHSVTLSGLVSNTTYYYNLTACNSLANCTTAGTYNFTTAACVPDWSCTSWGSCRSDRTQTCITWTDANGCGDAYVGENARSCTYSPGGSSNPPGGSITPPKVEYTFDRIEPGILAEKEVSGGVSISVRVRNAVSRVILAVTSFGEALESIKESLKDRVYMYLEMNATGINDSDIEEAYIEFRVNKSWIEHNNIDERKVVLNRYQNGNWTGLNTELVGDSPSITGSFLRFLWSITGLAVTDEGYYTYRAKTPGFSYFAITGGERAEATGGTIQPGANVSDGGQQPENGSSGVKSSQELPVALMTGAATVVVISAVGMVLYRKRCRKSEISVAPGASPVSGVPVDEKDHDKRHDRN